LFLFNDHIATETLPREAFSNCGFQLDTFEVVPPDRCECRGPAPADAENALSQRKS
jgi:hypothetical protein